MMTQASDKKEKQPAKHSALRGWMESIVEAAVIVALMFCLCWPLQVAGASMQPALNDGDRVFISRAMAAFGVVARGDIVVCRLEDAGEKQDIVKRVVALPGDEIVIADGALQVNGVEIREAYASGGTDGTVRVTLADGEYFVMGDNREVSMDSRNLGPVRAGDLIGKVILRFYPFHQIKTY